MKVKLVKKNNGFALLFSVLISSLLLTIGLSIFSIALKELAISTAARQSIHAFFAADSGRECALYWDIKMGKIPTLTNNQSSASINCGQSSNLSVSGLYTPGGTYNNSATQVESTIASEATPVSVVSNGPNFYVEIEKKWANMATKDTIITTIVSYGHDSTADDRVERAIEQTY